MYLRIYFFKEFKLKLARLEKQNQDDSKKNSTLGGTNPKYEGRSKSLGISVDDESNKNPREQLEERFRMRRFDSTVSTSKCKRTFSKDLFTVDRGQIRARADER